MSLEVFHDPSDDTLRDLRLARLLSYWRSLAQADRIPARADIDPTRLGNVLPWVFLIDTSDPGGFRYRLVGTAIVREMGYDMTGQLVSQAYAGPDWAQVSEDYDWVIANRRPCLTRNRVTLAATTQVYSYDRLLLPLATDGYVVDMLVGAAIAHNNRDPDQAD